ncbi:MAG: hypothetical protein COU71_00360 [Parcubacteria group bacterium CG10_big_fil_rev_8_21_14_0_10_38_31]|nr:MAG: hypothetical protein COU71_00360 [Parcubacteria group bacterium CG10_big_fil_rev_8_21_14_0_10_38_31]
MIKRIQIIRELKRLRKNPVNTVFLNSLKMRLEVLVDNYPLNTKVSGYPYFKLKNLFDLRAVRVSLAGFVIFILLSASVATASQGSLPGERLYPVKIFTEEVRSATTIQNTAKAKLRTDFAKRRVNEIKEILGDTEIKSENLEIALTQFEKNLTKATDIIEIEKGRPEKKKDDDKLASIYQDIDKNKENLEKTLSERKNETENKQKELEEKIKNKSYEESEERETLIDELVEVKINREILEEKEENIRDLFKHKEKSEEIKEYINDTDTKQKKINDKLESKKNELKNKREVIKSREESKREVREKIMEELDNDKDKKEDEREDDDND